MKCVILAGGLGTRLTEETTIKPKPLVEIGGMPILVHIMKIYSAYGINDFVVCLGYRGYMIKEYFSNYFLHSSDLTIDIAHNKTTYHQSRSDPWRVTLVDTGEATQTGGRIRRIRNFLDGDGPFFMTYGDGLSDINIADELEFHKKHGLYATVTVVHPTARFGAVVLDGHVVRRFEEKPVTEGGYINGGFFILNKKVLDLIEGDDTFFEREPMETLSKAGQLAAYVHKGFWQPMDTLREKNLLENLWQSGRAPWKKW